jgi:hypothetical protein
MSKDNPALYEAVNAALKVLLPMVLCSQSSTNISQPDKIQRSTRNKGQVTALYFTAGPRHIPY